MTEKVQTTNAPQPAGAYSQGLKVGNLVVVAGQGPADPVTGKPAGDTIEEQMVQVMRNIQAILETAGSGLEHVVKSTVHLSDLQNFARFDAAWNPGGN